MKILYFLQNFPKLSESFILNELYQLNKRGHDLAVFALNPPTENITHAEYQALDIPLRYADELGYVKFPDLISQKTLNMRVLKNATFKAPPKQHAAALHWTRQCIEFVEEINMDIDLIHTHYATLKTLPARYVSSYYDIPCTATTHAFDLYSRPNISHIRYFINSMDHLVTISKYNKDYIENEITNSTPISVVRAGIRTDKFEPSSSSHDQRILTVARLVEKKGLKYALRAISQLVDEHPDLEYHIIGKGPMESELRRTIDEFGLKENVELLNQVSDNRIVAEFDEAACFILPCVVAESGDRDGIPVVLMEAMAMETPPISTRVSGIPELIDHEENGLLVPPRDSRGLATAIHSIMRDRDKQRMLGKAGREKVKREFNVTKEVTKLESVFEAVIDER